MRMKKKRALASRKKSISFCLPFSPPRPGRFRRSRALSRRGRHLLALGRRRRSLRRSGKCASSGRSKTFFFSRLNRSRQNLGHWFRSLARLHHQRPHSQRREIRARERVRVLSRATCCLSPAKRGTEGTARALRRRGRTESEEEEERFL